MSEACELLEPSFWGTGCPAIRAVVGRGTAACRRGAPVCRRPPILLADEPTGNSSTGRHVIELIMALPHRDVLVTHIPVRWSGSSPFRDGRIASDQLTGCQPSPSLISA